MKQVESVATIVESFPIPVLTALGDLTTEPSYQTLRTVQTELNTNAASYETTQGTGRHGHLVLTMTHDDFSDMTAIDNNNVPIDHLPPPNPGALAANATTAAARTHGIELHHFGTYHAVNKALKQQLMKACPNIYLTGIKHPLTSYANVTTLEMLTHLWTLFGEISPADLTANLKTLSEPWHPSTSIDVLFQRIEDGRTFAIAGESPIDDNTTVRITYDIFFNTGLFEHPCREWRAKPKADKTYANLQQHFRIANRDRAATTGSAGYKQLTANALVTQQDTIAGLLASHNQLQLAIATLVSDAKANKRIKTSTPASTTASTTASTIPTTKKEPTFFGYCHTHGTMGCFKQEKIHNSANCKNPGPNHKHAATEQNKMGGNEKIWGPRQTT